MVLEQAIYGAERGGHALLLHSRSHERAPFAALTTRTDLPGTPPPGTDWEPYVSGYAFEGFYILSKTTHDRSATRGGMVITQAVAAPVEEFSDFADLRSVLRLLDVEPARTGSLEHLEVIPEQEFERRDVGKAALELAEHLIAAPQAPVVWLGQAGFTDAIAAVWAGLSPHLRRSFRFRLSFGPQDCQDERPTAVCTPVPLESRWAGYQIVNEGRARGDVSDAARLLLRLPEAETLARFSKEVAARIGRLSDFRLLERCYELAGRAAPTAYELVEAIRLIGYLSPSTLEGQVVKRRLSGQLAERVPSMKVADLQLMRNLDFGLFPGDDAVWRAVEAWATVHGVSRLHEEPEVAKLWIDSAGGRPTPWRLAVHKGLVEVFAKPNADVARAVWNFWTLAAENVGHSASIIPVRADIEDTLSASAPDTLPAPIAEAVMQLALARSWERLHGAAASAANDPVATAEIQLKAFGVGASVNGLKAALRHANGNEIVQAALTLPDARLLQMATHACNREPSLLEALDIANPTWRKIFAKTLEQHPQAWRQVSDPMSLVARLVELSAPGDGPPVDVWTALAATPLADLSALPDQAVIYAHLDDRVFSIILPPTTEGWLKKLFGHPDAAPPTDARLRAAICEEHRYWPHLVNTIASQIGVGVSFFRRMSELSEADFSRWLSIVMRNTSNERPIDAAASELLGTLVHDRRWHAIAGQISAQAKYQRQDLRPALRACFPILGRWEKVAVRYSRALELANPSADELWQQLEELAAELYPRGPQENEIWGRSGGKDSVLEHDGEGRVRWRYAIRKLRNGGGGKIRPEKLLKEMQEDFAWNKELAWLAEQDEFRHQS